MDNIKEIKTTEWKFVVVFFIMDMYRGMYTKQDFNSVTQL